MSNPNDIQQFSDALAAAVEGASASVVRIEGRHRGPSSSGIVWSADGAIVTADHKIEREEGIEVGLPDGRKVPARLVGRDPGTDIAVLRAEATDLTPVTWVGAENLKVGHLVLALSRPGQTVRASLGVISAVGDEWQTRSGGKIDRYLATDVAHQRGFTGGLLIAVSGRGLGLNDAGLQRGQGIALPAATLERVVEALLAHGGVKRGYLGVGAHPVRLPGPIAEQAGHPVGLIVIAVQPGGPAEQAGVLQGDVLLSLDGHPLGDMGELQSLLGEERAGKEAALRLSRAGEVREIKVTLGAR
ncbi:MAG TPA: trypsin-like peptidase domain-containing protein [Thermoanaerobaculia bacterium]|jgi:S1-C subfamily serine protease|nr:trypsin-like peptidase domain-containing protein [Thermoanaerobaculia bacterium]